MAPIKVVASSAKIIFISRQVASSFRFNILVARGHPRPHLASISATSTLKTRNLAAAAQSEEENEKER
jgi:hypothetical protein